MINFGKIYLLKWLFKEKAMLVIIIIIFLNFGMLRRFGMILILKVRQLGEQSN